MIMKNKPEGFKEFPFTVFVRVQRQRSRPKGGGALSFDAGMVMEGTITSTIAPTIGQKGRSSTSVHGPKLDVAQVSAWPAVGLDLPGCQSQPLYAWLVALHLPEHACAGHQGHPACSLSASDAALSTSPSWHSRTDSSISSSLCSSCRLHHLPLHHSRPEKCLPALAACLHGLCQRHPALPHLLPLYLATSRLAMTDRLV